jgi:uncharacterized protein (DUF488 family)
MATLLTIGHSNRSLELFVSLLQGYAVATLVDVRTVPRSRHNPQFNQDSLPVMLKVVGIGYRPMPELGGLRSPQKESLNDGWKNSGFRGFADYMQTPEFEKGLAELIELAKKERVAIMCAEAVPWRCHRSLISDALTVRGAEVRHIMSRVSAPLHDVTSWAQVHGKKILYGKDPTLPLFT